MLDFRHLFRVPFLCLHDHCRGRKTCGGRNCKRAHEHTCAGYQLLYSPWQGTVVSDSRSSRDVYTIPRRWHIRLAPYRPYRAFRKTRSLCTVGSKMIECHTLRTIVIPRMSSTILLYHDHVPKTGSEGSPGFFGIIWRPRRTLMGSGYRRV